ncbi:MAG TPA: toll/interleukin-1 receptor domain-containing protein [Gemmataceae bacterium]|nr:toll/interleukin-1 receptor domain-containing protein [Gemmataceae bacterium]
MAKKKVRRTKSRTRPYQIFLSHSTSDKWLAKVLCEKIEATGATTFRDDRDICGGDDIPEGIRIQIKQSKEVVVLLTPQSIGRLWVILEVGAAWGWSRRIRILPIMYHVSVDTIPDIIKNKKAIPLNDFDQYAKDLTERVREYHGRK